MSNEDDEDDSATIGVGRYPCMPSLVALQQMRNRLHLAHLGKKLMKWSALATGRELRKIAIDLNDTIGDFSQDLIDAYIMLARSRYYYPNLNKMVLENVEKQAALTISTTVKSVSAGVKCFAFEILEEEKMAYQHLGIEKGGTQIKETKIAWANLLKKMVLLLQLRNSFSLVEAAHKSATKKHNVISKLIIPRTQATIHYILLELEELAREELFRIKKVVQNKAKHKKKAVKKLDSEENVCKPEPELETKPCEPESKPCEPESKPREPESKPCEPESKPYEPESKPETKPCAVVPAPPPQPIVIPTLTSIATPLPPTNADCASKCQDNKYEDKTERKIREFIDSFELQRSRIQRSSPSVCTPASEFLKRSISKVLSVQPERHGELKILKSQLESAVQSSKGFTDNRTTFNYGNFLKLCEDIKAKVTNFFYPSQNEVNRLRLLRLKEDVSEIIKTGQHLKNKTQVTSELEALIKESNAIDRRLTELMEKQIAAHTEPVNEIDMLKRYIRDLEKMTNEFKTRGLSTPGTEDFLQQCKEVKKRISAYKQTHQPCSEADVKLKLLQSRVANIEDMARNIKEKRVNCKSMEKFAEACKDFRSKIEAYKNAPRPNEIALKRLLNQLDDAIELSLYAKKGGLIDKSVDSFIKSCANIKQYLLEGEQPANKQISINRRHPVLDELQDNIVNVMDLINKLNRDGFIDDSLTDFMQACHHTRKTINSYDAHPRKQHDNPCNCKMDFPEIPFDEIPEFIRSTKYSNIKYPNEVDVIPPCRTCGAGFKTSSRSDTIHIDESLSGKPSEFSKKSKFSEDEEGEITKKSILRDTSNQSSQRYVENDSHDEGVYENTIKKIYKVQRTLNDDGTINEVKETVTIKVDSHNPDCRSLSEDLTDIDSIASTKSGKSDKLITVHTDKKQNLGKTDDEANCSACPSTESKAGPSNKKAKSVKMSPGNNNQGVGFCTITSSHFGWLMPTREVKSESIFSVEAIAPPSLRHCISMTAYKQKELNQLSESNDSLLENRYHQSQIYN